MNEFERFDRPEETAAETAAEQVTEQPQQEQPTAAEHREDTTYHYSAPQYGTWQSETAPQPEPVKAKKTRKKHPGLKIAAIALCCSLLGAILGAAGVVAYDRQFNGAAAPSGTTQIFQGNSPHTKIEIVEVDKDKLLTAAEVYAANVNSTVGITTSVTVNYWG